MTHPTALNEIDPVRLQEAADWVQRLQTEPEDEALLASWLQWSSISENSRAFEQVSAVWQALETPRLQAVLERSRTTDNRARLASSRSRWMTPRIAMAAGLLLSLGVGVWYVAEHLVANNGSTFTTEVAEHKTEWLADGSRVDLGADSRLRVRMTNARRDVVVTKGEAFFTVARDAARPFVVTAGEVRVVVLGTQFNVRRTAGATVVTVREGSVRVQPSATREQPQSTDTGAAPMQAGPGEQVRYSEPLRRLSMTRVDPELAASWRQGVMKFVDEPLSSVVAYVTRYSTREIRIDDSDLAARTYTGTVYGGEIDEWLLGLERIYPLRVVPDGARAVTLVPNPGERSHR
jgi:transmembrane sensor